MMIHKPFLNWMLNGWPDNFKTRDIQCMSGNPVVPVLASESVHWNYSFALGFFGFHYIRAAKEHDSALETESLQILRKLIIVSNLDTNFIDYLQNPGDWDFLGFWTHVIRQISVALGDSLGPASKQMVELGFWLAAGYSGLVEESNSDDAKIEQYLDDLKNCLSDLVKSSLMAGIPEPLIKPLRDTAVILERSGNSATASKCMKTLKVTINNLFSFEGEM